MRICPRCLSVYGSSRDLYCKEDGERTFDTASIEAEEPCKRLIKRLQDEVKPNSSHD